MFKTQFVALKKTLGNAWHKLRGCKTFNVIEEGACSISVASMFGRAHHGVPATWWIGTCAKCGKEYAQIDCGGFHQEASPDEIRRGQRFLPARSNHAMYVR